MGGINVGPGFVNSFLDRLDKAQERQRLEEESRRRREREDFVFDREKKRAEREDNAAALKSSAFPTYNENPATGTFTAGINPSLPTNIVSAATRGAARVPAVGGSLATILEQALNPQGLQFPKNDGSKLTQPGPNPFQVTGKTAEEINRLREIDEFNRRLAAQSEARIKENEALMKMGVKLDRRNEVPAVDKFRADVRRDLADQAEEGRQNRFEEMQDSKPAPKPAKDPASAQAEKEYQSRVKEWRRQKDEFERESDELAKEARSKDQDVNTYIKKYQRKRDPGPMPQPVDPRAAQEMQALDAQTSLLARQRQRATAANAPAQSVRRYSVDLP